MAGPCLCGDPYCGRCFGAAAAYDPPDACPQCGGPNSDSETGDVLDGETDTCGRAECREAEKSRRRALALEERERDRLADEAEAQWLAELERMTP